MTDRDRAGATGANMNSQHMKAIFLCGALMVATMLSSCGSGAPPTNVSGPATPAPMTNDAAGNNSAEISDTHEWDDVAYTTIRDEIEYCPDLSPPMSFRSRYLVISPANDNVQYLKLLAERLRYETLGSSHFMENALVFTDTRAARLHSFLHVTNDDSIDKCFVFQFRRRTPIGLPGEITYAIYTQGRKRPPEICFKQEDTGAARYQR